MSDIAVDLVGVRVGYPTRRASISLKGVLLGREQDPFAGWTTTLDGVSLRARHGERIGIVGRNGAGKTTLLKVIAGIYPPIAGVRRASGRIAPVIAQGIGFDAMLSVRNNIRLGLLHADRLEDADAELEREILDFAELQAVADAPLATLSSGMRARLSFSVSMFQSPDILLLDEVFAAGDAAFVRKAQALTLARVAEVPILFFVSHAEDQIRATCARCVMLEGGRIVADGPADAVLAEYARSP